MGWVGAFGKLTSFLTNSWVFQSSMILFERMSSLWEWFSFKWCWCVGSGRSRKWGGQAGILRCSTGCCWRYLQRMMRGVEMAADKNRALDKPLAVRRGGHPWLRHLPKNEVAGGLQFTLTAWYAWYWSWSSSIAKRGQILRRFSTSSRMWREWKIASTFCNHW